jgi:Putative Ig domain
MISGWGGSLIELSFRVGVHATRVAVVAATATLVLGAQAAAAPFFFSTGNPSGLMAVASRPASVTVQIEAGDDFAVTQATSVTGATFTGLLPSGALLSTVQQVQVEIYGVFPDASDLSRTSGAPTFSTANVVTRVNSPSDVDFAIRDSASGGVSFTPSLIAPSFTASNSVLTGIHPKPNQTTGGEGPVAGEEVTFNVSFTSPIELSAGHYFFVPQVKLSSGNFFWLSAPRPIVAPGTPFPAGFTDLQSWIRNGPLAPDWLRVGTDVVGGSTPPTFNAAFSLSGATCSPISISPTSVPGGTAGSPYAASLTGSGGVAPYRFTETGALPSGLSLSSAGVLSGTPSQAGSFPIVLTASDANGCLGTGNVTIAIAAAPPGGGPPPGGTPPPQKPPAISSAHLSPSRFRAASRGGTLARQHRTSVGTTISYRDSEAAVTTISVLKPALGHKRAGSCVAGRARKRQKRCTRLVTLGSVRHTDSAGIVRLRFTGRLRGHALGVGQYTLTLTPKAHGQLGRTVKLSFRIVRS